MIPARIGSQRLKLKNLALVGGSPLIYYSIDAAKNSKIFNKIFINSDHDVFGDVAKRYKVDFYRRPTFLGGSEIRSDDVILDFLLKNEEADILVWVNSIAPLQTAIQIEGAIKYFFDEKLDSLITVEEKQTHCTYKNMPINFDREGKFERTQDLIPVESFVYSLMIWRRTVFLESYAKYGHALFCGKFGTYAVDKLSSFIVKTEEDLNIVSALMKSKNSSQELNYDVLSSAIFPLPIKK